MGKRIFAIASIIVVLIVSVLNIAWALQSGTHPFYAFFMLLLALAIVGLLATWLRNETDH